MCRYTYPSSGAGPNDILYFCRNRICLCYLYSSWPERIYVILCLYIGFGFFEYTPKKKNTSEKKGKKSDFNERINNIITCRYIPSQQWLYRASACTRIYLCVLIHDKKYYIGTYEWTEKIITVIIATECTCMYLYLLPQQCARGKMK